MKLTMISDTPHHVRQGTYLGFGPTVRELDVVAELFSEMTVVVPVSEDTPPATAIPYEKGNVKVRAVPPAGGDSLPAKLDIARKCVSWATAIREEIRTADAIHIRCPASISTLAILLRYTKASRVPTWIKYAGNWAGYTNEPITYSVQRKLLRFLRGRVAVTVNGKREGDPEHIHDFLNPCLNEHQLEEGIRVTAARKDHPVGTRVLFAGSLTEHKGPFRALQVALNLRDLGIECSLDFVGDGSQRDELEARIRTRGHHFARCHGRVPPERMGEFYAKTDFIILPSRGEGWPKVLSEAMAYGVIPISSDSGSMPGVLKRLGCGRTFHPDDVDGMTRGIRAYLRSPSLLVHERSAALEGAKLFSYQGFKRRIFELFADMGCQLEEP